jgi:hypothetical protein
VAALPEVMPMVFTGEQFPTAVVSKESTHW